MTIRNFVYFKQKISEINKIVDADEERVQVMELQLIKGDLEQVENSFSSAISEISALSQFLNSSLSDESFFVKGKAALSEIRKKFAQSQTVQSVKEGRNFVKLQEASSEAIIAKNKALDEAKKIFKKNNLASCEDPISLRKILVLTPSNKATLEKYEQKYTDLISKIDAMKREHFLQDLSELKKSCREIEGIFLTFETDYPESVDKFMKLVRTSASGVKLSDLSHDQLSWLKENGLADQYKVMPN